MGIKQLNDLLRTRAPRGFRSLRADQFAGTRVAVDTPIVLFQSVSGIHRTLVESLPEADLISLDRESLAERLRPAVLARLRSRITDFAREFVSRGIYPLFVFDGEPIPDKRVGAHARRAASSAAALDRADALRAQLAETDPIFRQRDDVKDLRKRVANMPSVSAAEKAAAQAAVRDLGLVPLIAPNEAEKYCAFLAKTGVASAAWTTDTDSYAFGAPVVLLGFDKDRIPVVPAEEDAPGMEGVVARAQSRRPGFTHFLAGVAPSFQRSLGLSHPQFVDLCILLECDFNAGARGVGPKRAGDLVTAAARETPAARRLIELIAAGPAGAKHDFSTLNAERCREIFLDHSECEAAWAAHAAAVQRAQIPPESKIAGAAAEWVGVKFRDVRIRPRSG